LPFKCNLQRYITGLYFFNVKYVNATLHEFWPTSVSSILVPDDLGLFDLNDTSGYAYLYSLGSRIGTLVCVLFHKRWLDWKSYRDAHPTVHVDDDSDLLQLQQERDQRDQDEVGLCTLNQVDP
jgi:hypothetical protein